MLKFPSMLKAAHIIPVVAVLLILAGCSKQPEPPRPPSPMTEAYLLAHMHVNVDATNSVRSISPLPIVETGRLCEQNATISAVVTARQTIGSDVPTDYLLLLSIRSSLWGEYIKAFDSHGNRLDVTPYTSNIRRGRYTENFYIRLDRAWMEDAARDGASLLLLGKQCDIGFDIPRVYPSALLTFLKSPQPEGP